VKDETHNLLNKNPNCGQSLATFNSGKVNIDFMPKLHVVKMYGGQFG
jgi:hypothetical protein